MDDNFTLDLPDEAATLQFAAEMSRRYPGPSVIAVKQEEMSDYPLDSTDLLINTTSLGMHGESLDFLRLSSLPGHAVIFDMVYAPLQTPLLLTAEKLGLRAVNGLGMLAAQGEYAFKIWTGQLPPTGLMIQVLRSVQPLFTG